MGCAALGTIHRQIAKFLRRTEGQVSETVGSERTGGFHSGSEGRVSIFQRKRLGMKTTKLGFFQSKALVALRTLVQFQGIWCPLASMGNHKHAVYRKLT